MLGDKAGAAVNGRDHQPERAKIQTGTTGKLPGQPGCEDEDAWNGNYTSSLTKLQEES